MNCFAFIALAACISRPMNPSSPTVPSMTPIRVTNVNLTLTFYSLSAKSISVITFLILGERVAYGPCCNAKSRENANSC